MFIYFFPKSMLNGCFSLLRIEPYQKISVLGFWRLLREVISILFFLKSFNWLKGIIGSTTIKTRFSHSIYIYHHLSVKH